MRNIKLLIEYEGTHYQGWQTQKEGPTVQSALEGFIEKLTGEKCVLIGAGRTDAGVHALGQVAAFKTSSMLDTATIKRALNALLPPDIRVREASEAVDSFHPRYSSSEKTYFYFIANTGLVSPFLERYLWLVPQELDIAAMAEAADILVGRHDFRAFMGAGSSVRGSVREVRELSVEYLDAMGFLGLFIEGKFIRIRVKGDGFLRHMVRNMAGTLVEVAKGKIKPEAIKEILASGDRSNAGPTAPAKGLFLEKVLYVP
jgi:tRNA pseudouridine38-40 synthase